MVQTKEAKVTDYRTELRRLMTEVCWHCSIFLLTKAICLIAKAIQGREDTETDG
jgi:hypothetical protein